MDLLQSLIKKKVIDKKSSFDLKVEERETGKTLEELILEKKLIDEVSLFKLKSDLLKIPLKEISIEEMTAEALSIIPKESVEFYKMVPFNIKKEEAVLEIGMVYPENNQAQEALKFLTRQHDFTSKIFLMTLSNFQRCLGKYRLPEREVEKALETLEEEAKTESMENAAATMDKAAFARLVEEAPTIKMVAVILRQAVEGGASDIHIEPTSDSSKIRYRMDGVLYTSIVLPLKVHPAIVARIKILSDLKIDETRMPQDGRFSTKFGDKRVDYRVSTFPTTTGEKVVLRILDPSKGMKSLEDLGLQGRNLQIIKDAFDMPYGMLLVTGPTGSGKTTTLYAGLKILNKDDVNIVTLEDPVEYFLEGINQSQVRPEINYTFARGLRQILRQDPDIIMVGEIRDDETAELAVHAALTGHLVLSTLHTNNAPGAVPRLVDMGVKPFLIPPSVSVILSQRLVRLLCPACKKKIEAKGEVKKFILDHIKAIPQSAKVDVKIKEPLMIYQAVGCKECNKKGYTGRQAVFEVLKMTDKMADIITKDYSAQAVMQEARSQGMTTVVEDGLLRVIEGVTTIEEVIALSEEK